MLAAFKGPAKDIRSMTGRDQARRNGRASAKNHLPSIDLAFLASYVRGPKRDHGGCVVKWGAYPDRLRHRSID